MENLDNKANHRPVTIQFNLEAEDYKKYLYFDRYAKDRRFFPTRIALSFALGLLVTYIHNTEQLEPLFFIGMSVVFFLIFMVSPAFEIYLAVQKFLRKVKKGDFERWQIFRFSKKGIEVLRNDGAVVGEFSFNQVYLAAETKTLFLVYFNKKRCVVIPKRFIDQEDYSWLMYLMEVRLRDRFRRLYKDISAQTTNSEGQATEEEQNRVVNDQEDKMN